jgi:hypothetical protein
MIYCIFGKARRLRQAQLVGIEILVCHVTECTDSLLAQVGEVVEACLQLAFALLLSPFGNGFRGRL